MTTHLPEAGKVWERFVATGDSFTEGMNDDHPEVPDRFIGWADRLAGHLAGIAEGHGKEFHYANLGVRGRLMRDIVGEQVDAALEMEPDLVSIIGAGNDILRPRTDLSAIARGLEDAVIRCQRAGADVLLATPVDTVAAPFLRRLRGRFAVHATNVFTIAQRHGCYVLNQWGMRALRDPRMWSTDRIHMTAEGHRRVALAALSALGHDTDHTDWHTPLPPLPRPTRRDNAAANAEWARLHLQPWVKRRIEGRSSGDGVDPKYPKLGPVDRF